MTSTTKPDIGSFVIHDNLAALVELQQQQRWVPGMVDLATSVKYSAQTVTEHVLLSFTPDTGDLDALRSMAFYANNALGMQRIILVGGNIRTRKYREFLRTCFLQDWPLMARVLLDGFRRNGMYTTHEEFLHDFDTLSMAPETCTLTRRIMGETYGTTSSEPVIQDEAGPSGPI